MTCLNDRGAHDAHSSPAAADPAEPVKYILHLIVNSALCRSKYFSMEGSPKYSTFFPCLRSSGAGAEAKWEPWNVIIP